MTMLGDQFRAVKDDVLARRRRRVHADRHRPDAARSKLGEVLLETP
jgi:hypothetical protein